ncbi:MAG: TonB-dependent receptor [Pseudomonadota bacterium]
MKSTPNNTRRARGLKRKLAFSAGLGALWSFAAPGAFAQDAAEVADEAEDTRRLDTIEVTATRRQGVTVQDVPIAVTAYDAELLQQTDITDLTNLAQLSPSILSGSGQSASAGTSISIRGLGTPSDDFGFEPAVGIFIDGVYRTRTGVAAQELPQLSGVEVLRGPQGTLFGRNTSAGVVSFRTAKPEYDPRFTATVGYGNFDEVEVSLTATGATFANSASRIDAKYRRRDGLITDANSDNEFNNLDRFFVRGQHLWEKGQSSLRLIADYTETNEDCCAGVQLGTFEVGANAGTFDPVTDSIIPIPEGTIAGGALDDVLNALAAAAPLTGSADGPLIGVLGTGDNTDDSRFDGAFSPNRPFRDDIQDWGVSAEFNHDFEFGRFTSITAYRDFESIRDQDIDFSGIDRAFREDQMNNDATFTQEFRLQGLAFEGKLDWLVGTFYLNQRIDATETIRFGSQANQFTDLLALAGAGGTLFGSLPPDVFAPGIPPLLLGIPGPATATGDGNNDDNFDLDTNSIAIFSHNEFQVTDRLTVTGGIRYSYEKKTIEADLNTLGVPGCDLLLNGIPGLVSGDAIAGAIGGLGLLVCNPAINSEFDGQRGDARVDSEVTGTAKFAYEITPDVLFFGGYSRGFKSGSFNLTRSGFASSIPFDGLPADEPGDPLSELEFEAETVNAYEAGLKTSWFDGRYTANISAYFQDVEDFQENAFNGTNFITVGTEVEAYGVEIDLGASPIEGLVLQGGFAYNSVERAETVPVGTGFLVGGQQLGGSPEFVVTGQGTYTREIVPGIEGVAHLNFRWNSAAAISSLAANLPLGEQEAFALVGARLSVQDADGRWRASLLAENLFDQEFDIANFSVPEQPGNFAVFPGRPRFWGGEISVTF